MNYHLVKKKKSALKSKYIVISLYKALLFQKVIWSKNSPNPLIKYMYVIHNAANLHKYLKIDASIQYVCFKGESKFGILISVLFFPSSVPPFFYDHNPY